MKKIKDLPKGTFFKLKVDSKKVYIRWGYIKESGINKYECSNFDDINEFIYLKGTTEVLTDFEF